MDAVSIADQFDEKLRILITKAWEQPQFYCDKVLNLEDEDSVYGELWPDEAHHAKVFVDAMFSQYLNNEATR